MRLSIKARMRPNGPWLPAILTTERAESSYGLPVVVLHGAAFGPAEVDMLRVPAKYAVSVRAAGYRVEAPDGRATPGVSPTALPR